MQLFYDLGICLYYCALVLASPFNVKARFWVRGRRGQFKRMRNELKGVGPVAWFHASSLGEFEQGRPIMEAWKQAQPDLRIVLTFFSPSGYEIRKNYPGADRVYYLPLDTPRNARRFLQLVQPQYAVFIKYEFWYHFLKECHRQGTRLVLASAIFRPEQLFFKPYGGWYRKMLGYFNHIFVQDENSFNLLTEIGLQEVSIAGDTRFDRVAQIAASASTVPLAETFSQGRFTYVFGSTWEKDEAFIVRYILEHQGNARFIIAPHEIGAAHIRKLQAALPGQVVLYTDKPGEVREEVKVLIINTIGLLSAIYRYGAVAYIGGGFGTGIHNILEPAVYGMPVVFGPNYTRFREAVELVNEGGAFSIASYHELKAHLDKLENSSKALQQAASCTKDFVQRNLGATQVILEYLKKG